MPGRIRTYTGRLVDPFCLSPEDITIQDIAHALSNLCRFTGHSRTFYSVAQHCVLVSRIVPPPFKLAGLLHDADEAYLGDIAGPTKYRPDMAFYREAGHRIQKTIFEKFGADAGDYTEIKKADTELYEHEKVRLMRPDVAEPYRQPGFVFNIVGPYEAEMAFRNEFSQLTGGY